MSNYVVFARKYRPDSFETLVGQDNIAQTLKNSIVRGKLAHAYLFCGPRGVGKTSTARIFAKAINCEHPSAEMEPCGECESCRSFQEGRSYCIHELDAASNNGVEDIKALMDQVQIPPQVGKYSVYIIDEVHMLSQAAFNAFLKTLEEPPAHAIFILATTEKHKIIPTILSRCQTYDFNRISVSGIVHNLRDIAQKEGITVDDESLHIIAQKADGAMRDALSIFDQTVAFCGTDIHYADVMRNLNVLDYEYSFKLVDSFISGDYASAMLIFDEVLAKGFNAQHFISALSSHVRDLIVSRTAGLDVLLDTPDSLKIRYKTQAESCSLGFLYDVLSIATQCEAGYKAAVNQRLHIEFALMKMAFLLKAPAGQAAAKAPAVAAPVVAPAQAPAASAAPKAPVAVPAAPAAPAASVAPVAAPAAPAAAPAPSAPVQEAAPQAPAAPAADAAPAPSERPKRRGRAGASLSLGALMSDEPKETVAQREAEVGAVASVSDEDIRASWPRLAALYSEKPRLANAIATAKLEIEETPEYKEVTFVVMNEAQKVWIEQNLLRSIEEQFRKMMNSSSLRLAVKAAQYVEQKVVYTQAEKAREMMENHPEMKDFVKDLGLDLK
ncbi:MAG: DNA polymerase III subunit gamma/tau [Bacteroidales bacterium]|nr:DNA polymerase III subunit gamma/tau [Bacteroidales bacterium]